MSAAVFSAGGSPLGNPAGAVSQPRGERIASFGLALAMHLLLALMLLLGLRWQTQPPVAVQAELWSAPPREPTPREAQPRPAPETPPPTPAQPKALPEPPKPDIALEKRQEKERLDRERLEAEKRERELQARRKVEAQKEAELRKVLDARREADNRKAAADAKAAEAKARQEEQTRQEEQAQQRSRDDHLRRIIEQAGRPGAAVGADAGGASGAAMGGWGAKVSSLIRSNTVFQIPAEMRGNPKTEFVISVMPDGTIAALRMTRSSGVPAWDQAAERAIRRSDPLPRPPAGAPREVAIAHGPRDE